MFNLWENELTEEESEALIQKAVKEIRRRKLEVPATVMLEMHKPLANVGGHAAIVFAPFTVPFLGFDFVNNYSRLLSKRELIDRLLDQIAQGRTDETEESCNTATQDG
ncbi:MAG: hypothetical protein M9921_09850 [Fimbriimonadaceae bacterium]|nr:hypothetical protein [Chthonomonadaceae bacterium]MCO5297147.1 hypothetical protein [Fimbriimonadaceae bacterium]